MVSDADEKRKWKKATLQSIDEEFTWHVKLSFLVNDVMNLEKNSIAG